MEKVNIKVSPRACRGCFSCQLRCSLAYQGEFNPEKARIMVEPSESITFTDECIPSCSLCATYCVFGALIAKTMP